MLQAAMKISVAGHNEKFCEICEFKFPLGGHLLEIEESSAGLRIHSGSRYEKYLQDLWA